MNKNLNLENLLVNKIAVLYDIENQLVKALPKMAKASSDQELKKGFQKHLEETKDQVKRLENIFKIMDLKPRKLKSEGIRGIIKDGEWVIKNVKPEPALDANIARAAQYVEHYEMAGYMGAISWAEELGEAEIAQILEETLQEEIAADEALDLAGATIQKEIII